MSSVIKEFLDKNPCLSEKWKKELIDIINSQYSKSTQIIKNSFNDDIQELIILNEGKEYTPYKDSLGNWSIGVGFNLHRVDAATILESVGAKIMTPNIPYVTSLSNDQIMTILQGDINRSIETAKNIFNEFDYLPHNVKLVIVDMIFNLGPNRFKGFEKLIAAIKNNDYNKAVNEMIDSKWYSQVGFRAKRLIELMKRHISHENS